MDGTGGCETVVVSVALLVWDAAAAVALRSRHRRAVVEVRERPDGSTEKRGTNDALVSLLGATWTGVGEQAAVGWSGVLSTSGLEVLKWRMVCCRPVLALLLMLREVWAS